jgi:hypothetical protein
MGQHAPGLAFQKRGRAVIWALRQIVYRHSFAGWVLGLPRLLLVVLRNRSLELEECHPLWYTYCMNAQ